MNLCGADRDKKSRTRRSCLCFVCHALRRSRIRCNTLDVDSVDTDASFVDLWMGSRTGKFPERLESAGRRRRHRSVESRHRRRGCPRARGDTPRRDPGAVARLRLLLRARFADERIDLGRRARGPSAASARSSRSGREERSEPPARIFPWRDRPDSAILYGLFRAPP